MKVNKLVFNIGSDGLGDATIDGVDVANYAHGFMIDVKCGERPQSIINISGPIEGELLGDCGVRVGRFVIPWSTWLHEVLPILEKDGGQE